MSTIGIVIMAAGALWLMIESGKVVVGAIGVVARRVGFSQFILSFVLVAFATSLPELSIGLNAAVSGVSELSFGDIIGTNIVNLTLVIGLVAVIGRGITISDYTHFKRNRLYQLLIVLAPMILLLDGTLSRTDGLILLALFVWNLFRFLDVDNASERKSLRPHLAPHAAGVHQSNNVWRQLGWFVLGAGGLIASTYVIVTAAEELAHVFMVPTVIIGLVIIATCSSLPELTVGVRSVLAGKGGVAIGDVFGAAAFNATLTLGLVALISPIVLTDLRVVWLGMGFTIFIMAMVFYFLHTKQEISRSEGVILLTLYGLFIIAQLVIV